MDRAKHILKDTFGYDSFRPLQHDIIKNILDKKDTLVVMPTGGGKSICYQIPALIFEGITIVISPLISLMKDQVEQLRQLGIKTALLNSSLTPEVYRTNFENVRNLKVKLLYVAPESLAKDEIINLLKSIQVDCITVDEAHCISEWGHDFRKDYRLLGKFRKIFPSAVCIGLTATATPRVQEDIITNLDMAGYKKFVASFNRENLFLQVIPKADPFRQTVDFLRQHPDQSGIIYCFSRKQVDDLNEDLTELGFSTKPYHAGLPDEERSQNQDLFIKDEVQIIIATIAFGMGINKSNVRFVLHYDLPKNIESYYQEIGRSGRDGLRSDCLLLFSYGDIAKINYFIDQKEDELERLSAKTHLAAMVKYAESEICRRNPLINYFGEHYDSFNCGMCDNCLAEEKELTDITVPAQKFLSTVKRTGEVFGVNYLIDILTGNDTDRILSNGHQNLTVFGIGKEYTKKQWHNIANQLVRKELLNRDIEFGSIKLTERATGVLFKNQKVLGLIKEPEIKSRKTEQAGQNYDTELFEQLRRKRKELAEDQGVPPYVIFSDKALAQMAIAYPQNEEELLNISGVGINKLERYGKTFLAIIKRYCSNKNIKKRMDDNFQPSGRTRRSRKNSSTVLRHTEIGEAYNDGSSIKELAEQFGIKTQTIVTHLARYATEGHELRMDGLIEELTLPKEKHKDVFEAFEFNGTFSMKTIFDIFKGEVSYEDLYIMKIIYQDSNK